MDNSTRKLLHKIASRYDLTLQEALALAPRKYGDYRDQYPLAMLIESEYVGVTLVHTPPTGAEKAREFTQATMLHELTEERSKSDRPSPTSVFMDAGKEHVFLKAKGALYLEELHRKRMDRVYSLIIGLVVGVCTFSLKAWFDHRPNQSLEPTGIAVTPSAGAEVAPAIPVAHH